MIKVIENVRGMRDLLNEDSLKKNKIEFIAREIASNFGYQEINTPIVEYSSVFDKALGYSTDIVQKEMYNFEDAKGRKLTLRPEATASIARAIVSNGLLGSNQYRVPLKLFLFGQMFRYERPQKGRYRQFSQINFEFFGKAMPESDVELISLANNFLKKINIPINLYINSLGDLESRSNHKKALVLYLKKYKNELSLDSRSRLLKNPLRILDTKNKEDLQIISGAPKIINFLSENSQRYYLRVKSLLKGLGIKYKEDSNLVRGLDYYKDTVFEFKTDKLGKQQDTVLGGGRYTDLVKMFGGDDIDGVGWAAGLDRLISLISKNEIQKLKASIVYDEKYKQEAFKLADKIRNSDKIKGYIEINYQVSIDKQIKKASKLNSKYIIYVKSGNQVKITDLKNKNRPNLSISNIKEIIKILNDN